MAVILWILKKNVIPNRLTFLLFHFLVAFASTTYCTTVKSDSFETNELRFREVLYNYYLDQYQKALSDLEILRRETPANRLPYSEEITAGELNLSYGLLHKTEQIYQQLSISPGSAQIPVNNWLELARIYLAHNSLEKSARALSHVKSGLNNDQLANYNQINTDLLIARGKIPHNNLKPDPLNATSWQYYSQYNLGVALIRDNQGNEGIRILDELGAVTAGIPPPSEEIKALKDRANTTLGYYFLDAHNAERAISYFERVSFNSPSTNKALLGMGWAYAQLGKLNAALVPWMELQKGEISDGVVQESLLTVPYALNELKSQRQALEQYNDAIERYKKEIDFLNSQIELLKKVGWSHTTTNNLPVHEKITYQDINDKILENPYLDSLATDTHFLRTVNYYNDLISLRQTLQEAQRDISAYRSHLTNRKHIVLDEIPDTLHSNYVASLDARGNLDLLKQELKHIAQTRDATALMTTEEQHQLTVLKLINDNIAVLSKLFNLGRLDDKLRIYRGIIMWDITMDFDSRLEKARQSVADVETDINGLGRKRGEIKSTGQHKADNLDSYEKQLALLERRIKSALDATNTDIADQTTSMTEQIIAVLKQQQLHLTANLGQAYTSIAQLYEVAYLSGQKGNKQ